MLPSADAVGATCLFASLRVALDLESFSAVETVSFGRFFGDKNLSNVFRKIARKKGVTFTDWVNWKRNRAVNASTKQNQQHPQQFPHYTYYVHPIIYINSNL